MELRLWKYGEDDSLIPSFLEGKALSHKEPAKTEEWFHWKFEQSPYGKAFMACAFDGDKVAGCVAYGRGVVKYKGRDWTCALSYETFVHPAYQGKGLFKKLILLAEENMLKAGVQFLYNYPNANSVAGFSHMGWIIRNDVRSFKIKVARPFSALFRILDLKKPFVPNPSNLEEIRQKCPSSLAEEKALDPQVITPVWSLDYIRWRFFTIPNREYLVVDNEDVFSIFMVGKRGRLKCVHHLYTVSKTGKSASGAFKDVLPSVVRLAKPEVIEYSSTVCDQALTGSFGFFKVPAHGNFCYKVLDESMNIEDFRIILPSINAHTY